MSRSQAITRLYRVGLTLQQPPVALDSKGLVPAHVIHPSGVGGAGGWAQLLITLALGPTLSKHFWSPWQRGGEAFGGAQTEDEVLGWEAAHVPSAHNAWLTLVT